MKQTELAFNQKKITMKRKAKIKTKANLMLCRIVDKKPSSHTSCPRELEFLIDDINPIINSKRGKKGSYTKIQKAVLIDKFLTALTIAKAMPTGLQEE